MKIALSDYELGWLVGILEGEAYFGYSGRTQELKIRMTDLDTMFSVARSMSKITGNLIEVKSTGIRKNGDQELFAVAIFGENAREVMQTIVPHMHHRRRAKIWQSLNKYRETKKSFEDLGIDIATLLTQPLEEIK